MSLRDTLSVRGLERELLIARADLQDTLMTERGGEGQPWSGCLCHPSSCAPVRIISIVRTGWERRPAETWVEVLEGGGVPCSIAALGIFVVMRHDVPPAAGGRRLSTGILCRYHMGKNQKCRYCVPERMSSTPFDDA
ncbi:hypothetical protein NQZ68_008473 [Dissostichus eleginoides]|nr:hypothetical protein NQZ68_008473 [Dissostichus eleginoides]